MNVKDYRYYTSLLKSEPSPIDFSVARSAVTSAAKNGGSSYRGVQLAAICLFWLSIGSHGIGQISANGRSELAPLKVEASQNNSIPKVEASKFLLGSKGQQSSASTLSVSFNVDLYPSSTVRELKPAEELNPPIRESTPPVTISAVDPVVEEAPQFRMREQLEARMISLEPHSTSRYTIALSGSLASLFSLRLSHSLSDRSGIMVEFSGGKRAFDRATTTTTFRDTAFYHNGVWEHSTIGTVTSTTQSVDESLFWAVAGYRYSFIVEGRFSAIADVDLGYSNHGFVTRERLGVEYDVTQRLGLAAGIQSDQITRSKTTQHIGFDLGILYRLP
jgi:hypothetical protein